MPPIPAEPATPAPPADYGRAGRDLPAAIAVGVGLGGALALTLFLFPLGFVILVGIALAQGTIEVSHALRRVGLNASTVPLVAGTFAIVLGSYLAGILDYTGIDLPSNTVMLGLLGITALVTLIWRMPGGAEGYARDSAASLFIIAYIPLLGSFVGLMLANPDGVARVVTYISVVCAGDIGGYLFGVLWGKHKMAPKISPKKTWEGFVGSLVLGVATATWLMTWLLHAPWWTGIIVGVVLVFAGACGDLIESLIKRDVGIKDMSSILPGHGGIMDRMDSLLAAAPASWLVLYLLVPVAAAAVGS